MKSWEKAQAAATAKASDYAESLRDIIEPIADRSSRAIADELNVEGFRTPRGKDWRSMQVIRLLRRLQLPTAKHFAGTDT